MITMCVSLNTRSPTDGSGVQDTYSSRDAHKRTDSAARLLALGYASLASVLLALHTTAQQSASPSGGTGRSGAPEGRWGAPEGHQMQAGVHIPWRDAPLTRWLKRTLERATSVLVIATVHPGADFAADTLSTLNFVSRCDRLRQQDLVPGPGAGGASSMAPLRWLV